MSSRKPNVVKAGLAQLTKEGKMKNCSPKPRSIKAMLLQNPKALIRSFEQSLPVKISTDSPNAGGVIMESNTEMNLNKELLAGKPELCFATNRGLKRIDRKSVV